MQLQALPQPTPPFFLLISSFLSYSSQSLSFTTHFLSHPTYPYHASGRRPVTSIVLPVEAIGDLETNEKKGCFEWKKGGHSTVWFLKNRLVHPVCRFNHLFKRFVTSSIAKQFKGKDRIGKAIGRWSDRLDRPVWFLKR